MFKKLRNIVAGVLLLSTVLLPAPAGAHNVTPSHYYASCGTGSNSYNSQYFVSRDDYAYRYITATVDIVDLNVCGGTSSGDYGYALVNAVNFIASGASGQFGYAQESCVSPYVCGGGMTNLVTDFWWTPTDQSLNIHAATWVDIDQDGVHDRPAIGETYAFSINRAMVGTTDVWQYCVKVVSSSRFLAGSGDCTNINRSITSYMSVIWYGAEIWNEASQFGAEYSASHWMHLTKMGYKRSGTDSTPVWLNGDGACSVSGRTPYSGAHCTVTGGSPETMNVYTSYHP